MGERVLNVVPGDEQQVMVAGATARLGFTGTGVSVRLARGQQPHFIHLVDAALRIHVEAADALEVDVEEVEPNRQLHRRWEHIDEISPHGELPRLLDHRRSTISDPAQPRLEGANIELVARFQSPGGCGSSGRWWRDVERLTRRLRSVSQRLEGIEGAELAPPDRLAGIRGPAVVPNPDGPPSVFTAVQEQLGLELAVRFADGATFPREFRGAISGAVEATQFGPIPIQSPIKENTKFMNLKQLRTLHQAPHESRKIQDHVTDFIKHDQEFGFLRLVGEYAHERQAFGSEIGEHQRRHGDGVKVVALSVPSADAAYREAVARGATGLRAPYELRDGDGVVRADVGARLAGVRRLPHRDAAVRGEVGPHVGGPEHAGEEVVELEAHAADRRAHLVERLRVAHVHQRLVHDQDRVIHHRADEDDEPEHRQRIEGLGREVGARRDARDP